MDEYERRLRAKLAPESVMLTLTRAGCFLSAYELIKSEVVDKVHEFFLRGFDESGMLYDEATYQRDVLARDPKSKYRASCAWLVWMEALSVEQVAILEQIQEHRKEIAHELPKLLVDPDFEVKTDLLLAAVEIVRRLGVFWGSISADTDPQFDGQEIDYDEIESGSYLLMKMVLPLAGFVPDTGDNTTDVSSAPTQGVPG